MILTLHLLHQRFSHTNFSSTKRLQLILIESLILVILDYLMHHMVKLLLIQEYSRTLQQNTESVERPLLPLDHLVL